MTTLPSKPTASLPLSPERLEHREWVGGRAVTLLSHYWRDDDPVELTAAIGRDWAVVLEGIPQKFIELACVAYLREEPRRKPTPGAIYERARRLMPKPEVVREPEPEIGNKVSPERAAEIMAEVGFTPKRFGGKS